ncbi:MAG: c-type cytochrome [Gemmatimonadota bacterium]|nr:c-type cytochrome [Gemmatimonadota bacterium]
MRLSLAFLLVAGVLGAQPTLTTFDETKARALLRSQLPCLGCHELDGDGGHSAPSLTTVGARRSGRYIAEMIRDPQARLPGAAMPRHDMPAHTRDLITRFLSRDARGADVAAVASPPAASARAPDGAALYAKWCAACHGESGRGDGPNARDVPVPPARHADSAAMSKRPDDSLYDVIAAGGLAWGRSARMPAFGATLSDGEIRALVAHIRTLCKCVGPAWSRAGTHAGGRTP